MATLTALLDACVLYPQTLRDLFLNLARTDLFRARWTDLIGEILELGQVSSLRSHLNSRTGRDRQKKPRAVALAEHPRIEDHDYPTIGLRPDQPANTLLEFQDGVRHLVLVEPISSSLFDLFEPGFQERVAGKAEGKLGDDHIRESGAGNVHSLPESVRSKENAVDIGRKFLQELVSWPTRTLTEKGDSRSVEPGRQLSRRRSHHSVGGEQDESLALGFANELRYGRDSGVLEVVRTNTWFRQTLREIHGHLPLVIEGTSQLERLDLVA